MTASTLRAVTRVVLFDWTVGGHRPTYVRRLVEALRPSTEIVLALPQATLDAVAELEVETFSLGEPRPQIGTRFKRGALLAAEASLFRAAAERGNHAFHLYADHVLVRLIRERSFPARVSLLVYYPRAHYRTAYGSRLPASEALLARGKDWAVRAWRRRSDAQAVFTFDEEAARRWAARRGATAVWLPEAPVPQLPTEQRPTERVGCVVWGALDRRKGIDLLARALTLRPTSVRLVLAGLPEKDFRPELEQDILRMRGSGVEVDLQAYWHSEIGGLQALAGANCAVLSYRSHSGMSRVLLEACAMGTPVVAHDYGLLGHLVRTYQLGLAVNCSDPEALRDAVITMSDPAQRIVYVDRLAAFAARFTPERFRATLHDGLGLRRSRRDSILTIE